MDWPVIICINFAQLVNRVTTNIKEPTQSFFADRHFYWSTSIVNERPPPQPISEVHRHRPNDVISKMLLNFKHQRRVSVFISNN